MGEANPAVRLNFLRQGAGGDRPVLVLSHALGCDLGMWDGVAAALEDRYTVLRYDHRGHGRSELIPGPYSVHALADDAAMQLCFTPEFRADQPPGSAARVAHYRALLLAMDTQAYVDSCQAVSRIDFRKSNRRIACPALVIAGSRDEATPLAMFGAIHAGIQGAQLALMDTAHLSSVEQPTAFARLLSDFFDAQHS